MGLSLKDTSSYSFLKSIKKSILSDQIFCPGDKVLVAVSGGPDSVALFHVLRLLSHDFSIELGVAHLDHGIRGEHSKRDALFVKSMANDFNVPFFYSSANTLKVKQKLKLSLEEAARKIRYAFFRKLVIKYSFKKVSLGHHMEDNAELVLMFMIRGSGLKGLSGMLPIRDKYFVRPFIRTRKKEIIKFLLNERFNYMEDQSNHDLKFTRNKIRHYLLPILEKSFNPRIVENLNRTSKLINSENEWMDEVAAIEYERVLIEDNCKSKILLSASVLNELSVGAKRRVIRRTLFLLLGSLRQITFTHVESILNLAKSNSGKKELFLPNFIRVVKVYDILEVKIILNYDSRIYKKLMSDRLNLTIERKEDLPISLENLLYKFDFSLISLSDLSPWNSVEKNTVFLDLDRLQFPLSVGYTSSSDTFNPLGMLGSQKLKKYFTNKKIPLSERHKIPAVKDKDRIIWLVMHEICNHAKVSKETEYILRIKFYLLKEQ